MFSLNPFIPLLAQADAGDLSVKQIVYRISANILNPLIQVGFAVALVYFVWTIIMYIRERNSGYIFDKKDKEWTGSNGIKDILWAIFGLFIMASAFVIMRIMAQWIGSGIQTP